MNKQRCSRGGQPRGSDTAKRRLAAGLKRPRGGALHCESLEERCLLSANPIPVQFNIPADVASQGVYAIVSGQLTADYVTKSSATIPSGSLVYYDSAVDDYAIATASTAFTFQLSGNGAVVDLPNTYIKAGQIVIGVGSAPIVTYSATGIATPTASTNPTNYFGLFEFAITSAGLDIDMSEIDQVGVPFTITTNPAAPAPASGGVGITQNRGNLLDLYTQYIASQGPTAAPFQQSIVAGFPYRILAPQNVIDGNQSPVLGAPQYASGGSLTIQNNFFYYYWITATSGTGETGVSNVQAAQPYNLSQNGQNFPQATVELSWNAFGGATGYNVYRSTTNDPTTARLVGTAASGTTHFTDPGLPLQSQVPPSNSYTFNPLNWYFNNAIDAFFEHYRPANSFQLTRDGYNFTGNTTTYTDPATNYQYTALALTAPGLSGTYYILEPYFQNNTNIPGLPPAPAWLPHPHQSPGAMILANDGVFNSGGAQPGVNAGVLSDLENSIVSAFNRGIANNFAIAPNDWTSDPSRYYAPNSIANWYSAFLHQNSTLFPATGVSINGLAYGFPYDDQGGDSTNFQGQFSSVTINLQPWGPTPTPPPHWVPNSGPVPTPVNAPAALEILLQPASGLLGASTTVTFEALNARGLPFFGGATVTIQVVGAQQETFTVVTDPVTGIGTLTFVNTAVGFDTLRLTLASGAQFDSVTYHVSAGIVLPTDFTTPITPVPGPLSVRALGMNVLPATDVPNASIAGPLANAMPWTLSEGWLPPLGGVTRVASVESGPLGNFAPLARTGHGLAPEQSPAPNLEKAPRSPEQEAYNNAKSVLAKVVRAVNRGLALASDRGLSAKAAELAAGIAEHLAVHEPDRADHIEQVEQLP